MAIPEMRNLQSFRLVSFHRLPPAGRAPSRAPLRRSAGFSLVEVVLAIGIFGFAIVAILGLMPSLLGSSRDSWQDTRSAQIARQILSDLRPAAGGDTGALQVRENSAPLVVDLTVEKFSETFQCAEDGTPVPSGDQRAVFAVDVGIEPCPGDRTGLREVRIDIRPIPSGEPFRYTTRLGPGTIERP